MSHFEEQDWEPLKQALLADWMYMGRDGEIRMYKHRDTRDYLYVDQAGQTYGRDGSSYRPIPFDKAMEPVTTTLQAIAPAREQIHQLVNEGRQTLAVVRDQLQTIMGNQQRLTVVGNLIDCRDGLTRVLEKEETGLWGKLRAVLPWTAEQSGQRRESLREDIATYTDQLERIGVPNRHALKELAQVVHREEGQLPDLKEQAKGIDRLVGGVNQLTAALKPAATRTLQAQTTRDQELQR